MRAGLAAAAGCALGTRPAAKILLAVLAFCAIAAAAPSPARADAVERSLMDARTFAKRGQHAQAAQLYERLLAKNPNDMRVLNEYGPTLIVLRRFPEAEQVFRKLMAAAPTNETYPRHIERIHRLGGRHKDAIDDCVAVAVRFPSQSEWARGELASICAADPAMAEPAMAALKAAAAKNPKRADLRGIAAEIAFQAGHPEEAIAEARAADAAGGKKGELLFSVMGRARAAGKREIALALGEELRKAYPEASYRGQLLLLLGDLYAETKQPQLALAAYQEASAKPGAPEALRARLLAGKIYQTELRDYAAALAQYDGVDKKGLSTEERESLLLYQADCLLRMGDLDRAAAAFDEMALASPGMDGKERAAFERAELLFYQGKVPEASAEYYALTSKFPAGRLVDDAIDRIFLLQENADGGGGALLQQFGEAEYRARVGDTDGAVTRLQKIASEHAQASIVDDARFRIAAILAEAGRTEESVQSYHALAVDFPKSKYAPRALRRAGDILREAGRPQEAIKEYEALFSQYPQSLDAEEVRATAEELRRKVGS